MARFDRKVERTKKEYQFTQKEKVVETNKTVLLRQISRETMQVITKE